MSEPAFTSIDARDLWRFAQSLTLQTTPPESSVLFPSVAVVSGVSDQMGLSMLKVRLESIARNIQSLDEKAAQAFRHGELQATIRSIERSNVTDLASEMTEEMALAIRAGHVKVKTLPPAKPQTMKTELTIDDLELDL